MAIQTFYEGAVNPIRLTFTYERVKNPATGKKDYFPVAVDPRGMIAAKIDLPCKTATLAQDEAERTLRPFLQGEWDRFIQKNVGELVEISEEEAERILAETEFPGNETPIPAGELELEQIQAEYEHRDIATAGEINAERFAGEDLSHEDQWPSEDDTNVSRETSQGVE